MGGGGVPRGAARHRGRQLREAVHRAQADGVRARVGDPGRVRVRVRRCGGGGSSVRSCTAGLGRTPRDRWRCSTRRWAGCAGTACCCPGCRCWPGMCRRSGRSQRRGCTPRSPGRPGARTRRCPGTWWPRKGSGVAATFNRCGTSPTPTTRASAVSPMSVHPTCRPPSSACRRIPSRSRTATSSLRRATAARAGRSPGARRSLTTRRTPPPPDTAGAGTASSSPPTSRALSADGDRLTLTQFIVEAAAGERIPFQRGGHHGWLPAQQWQKYLEAHGPAPEEKERRLSVRQGGHSHRPRPQKIAPSQPRPNGALEVHQGSTRNLSPLCRLQIQ